MSTGWSLFVIVLIVSNLVGCAWLLWGNRHVQIDPNEKGGTTGHEYDGIEELNNPLPAWWTWLFIGTIVFSLGYFVLYPGFGNYAGTLGWSSAKETEDGLAAAEAKYGPIIDAYLERPIPELARDERAVGMGGRIFANRCATCHGSDARGGRGYPNLTDADWLHGGAPETIVHTITNGRNGIMPPFAAAIGGDPGVRQVTEYVLSLSGREHDAAEAEAGKAHFQLICMACHGMDGKGNPLMGSPDLTDDVWLHGGTREDIASAVNVGIVSQMPAHSDILSPGRIHLVASYVFSLSNAPERGN